LTGTTLTAFRSTILPSPLLPHNARSAAMLTWRGEKVPRRGPLAFGDQLAKRPHRGELATADQRAEALAQQVHGMSAALQGALRHGRSLATIARCSRSRLPQAAAASHQSRSRPRSSLASPPPPVLGPAAHAFPMDLHKARSPASPPPQRPSPPNVRNQRWGSRSRSRSCGRKRRGPEEDPSSLHSHRRTSRRIAGRHPQQT